MARLHEIPELDGKGLRNFALTIGGVVAGLFGLLLPWVFERPLRLWPWIFAGVLIAWGLIAPGSLRYVYRAWMTLGLLLNKITSPLIMAVVFFAAITPMGILRRLVGTRMPTHRDPTAKTYRIVPKENSSDLTRPF